MPAWLSLDWYRAPLHAIIALWLAWMLSWLIASAWSSRAASRPRLSDEAPNRIVTILGAVVIYVALRRLGPDWPIGEAIGWACFACVVAGVAFAWWARVYLGTLWSGSVTRKADHRIVDTGPYAIVRHPIYTGLLFGVVATGIAAASIWALVGAALVIVGVAMKARLEERFLTGELGEGAYAEYRARVPMLVPFWSTSRR